MSRNRNAQRSQILECAQRTTEINCESEVLVYACCQPAERETNLPPPETKQATECLPVAGRDGCSIKLLAALLSACKVEEIGVQVIDKRK